MPSRIHRPIATMTMLRKNGMRQPQTRNWSPEYQLKNSTATLARNSPAGPPNSGQEARKPRFFVVCAHSIASNTEPPHSPPTPIPWIRRITVSSTAPRCRCLRRLERGPPQKSQCRLPAKLRLGLPCGRFDRPNGRRSPPRSAARQTRQKRQQTPAERRLSEPIAEKRACRKPARSLAHRAENRTIQSSCQPCWLSEHGAVAG